MAYEFYLGIDVHSTEDGEAGYALSLVEKHQENGDAAYRLHDLRRINGSADDVASRVQNQISDDPFVGRTICIANASENEGADVARMLKERGLSPIAVRLSGGDAATQTGSGFDLSGGDSAGSDEPGLQVSEHDVVSGIETIYHDGRMEFENFQSDEPSQLVQGLEAYRQESREPGQEGLDTIRSEPTRDVEHADLVLATGIACWLAEQHSFDPTEHLSGDAPPVGEAKREMRPDTT